jgi:hypothetical protein
MAFSSCTGAAVTVAVACDVSDQEEVSDVYRRNISVFGDVYRRRCSDV